MLESARLRLEMAIGHGTDGENCKELAQRDEEMEDTPNQKSVNVSLF